MTLDESLALDARPDGVGEEPTAPSHEAASARPAVEAIAVNTPQGMRQWLARHVALAPGARLGLVTLNGSQGQQLAATHPADGSVEHWMLRLATAVHTRRERLIAHRRDAQGGTLHSVAHPIFLHGMAVGSVVLVMALDRAPSSRLVTALDASVAQLDPSAAPAASGSPDDAARVLQLAQRTMGHEKLGDAASALCMMVCTSLGCDRVSLGLLREGTVRVVGSSDGWESESPDLLSDVASLLSEALDNAGPIACPAPDSSNPGLIAAHLQLRHQRESRALCTVPWFVGGQPVGAILAERANGQAFSTPEVQFLESAGQSLAPWFSLKLRNARSWRLKLRDALQGAQRPGHKGRHRLAALAVGAGLTAFMVWPIGRELITPARLEGATQRIVTAPGDAFVRRVLVRPGDTVTAGQLLLEFDSDDLAVERTRVMAEMAGHDAAAGDAMARQDLGALAVHHAKVNESMAQLSLLDQRLSRARVVAPFDGVVIQGDLSNAIGTPAKKGDVMMTLAPLNDFRAIVEVNDEQIAEVHEGQAGAMVLTALPTRSLPLRVKRITPLATVDGTRSYFATEVELMLPSAGTALALRPGMQGIARFEGARGARAVVWWDEARAWLRFAWWRWGI